MFSTTHGAASSARTFGLQQQEILPSKPTKPDNPAHVLQALDQNLALLANLRRFGTDHPTYHNPNSEAPDCCEHVPALPPQARWKGDPLSAQEMAAIRNFSEGIARLGKHVPAGPAQSTAPADGPLVGFLEKIQNHAKAILDRDPTDPLAPKNVKHDMNILVSEAIADVLGKLVKHPNSTEAKSDAAAVLQLVSTHLGPHLQDSAYRDFFFGQAGQRLNGTQLLQKMHTYITQLRDRTNDAKIAADPNNQRSVSPDIAYEAAASIVLHMNKPAAAPTRIVGERRDHHNHFDPYDWNGDHHHITPMDWQARTAEKYGVQVSDDMPIPHKMLAGSFGKDEHGNDRDPDSLNDVTRNAYYADPNARTGFWGHDRSHLEERKKLDDKVSEALVFCATGLPVDAHRLDEVGKIARQIAKNVVEAQLAEGRKHISVDFGEITGYKPAVPQKMLGSDFAKQKDIQDAFVLGSSRVMTRIFREAEMAAAEAIKAHQAKGNDVSGIHTKTRIVFHADALPNQAASERPENKNGDKLKEATVMENIVGYARRIDVALDVLNDQEPVVFPNGVVHEHHLQAAHLMGASIAKNNYEDGDRATELHKAFDDFRKNCRTLRVTTDSSWLTASARAINLGTAQFLRNSNDPELQGIADLLKTADDLSNNGFMFLHGGERFFETHFLNGDNTDKSVLDMALARAAQKKAVTAYHCVLGELNQKLESNPALRDKLRNHVEQGVRADGFVQSGNYPGLFFKLATDNETFNRQDDTPIVWGTDNLTPGEARSGDLKMLQYISQHTPLEILLHAMSQQGGTQVDPGRSTYAQVLRTFMGGTDKDREFLGSKAKVSTDGIWDGPQPADAATGLPEKTAHPDALFNLRAPQDPRFPWADRKAKNIDVRPDTAKTAGSATRLLDRVNRETSTS